MTILKEVVEIADEGYKALLGQNVLAFCPNYIYAGKLIGVNAQCIKLEDAKIVYETGPFSNPGYKDAQALPSKYWYIGISLIESIGEGK